MHHAVRSARSSRGRASAIRIGPFGQLKMAFARVGDAADIDVLPVPVWRDNLGENGAATRMRRGRRTRSRSRRARTDASPFYWCRLVIAAERQSASAGLVVASVPSSLQEDGRQSIENAMRTYLIDLLERLAAQEPAVNSDDSVAWHAHREAEQLCDLSLVGDLDAFLNSDPPPRKRAAAYFILGKIGKNCGAPECARTLIGYASKEKDKYALSGMLDRLAEVPKPAQMDLAPLFALLEDKRWLVRHAAIRSLINVSSSESEEHLLALLGSTTDADDLIYCHATLNRIGTSKSLAALRSNLASRKCDVRLSAAAAIAAIEARNAP
jgi:HEAT repeat protein